MSLKYSEWRVQVLSDHPFKSLKDLASVNLEELSAKLEDWKGSDSVHVDLVQEEYKPWMDKLFKQITDEQSKAKRKSKEEISEDTETSLPTLTSPQSLGPIVVLTQPEKPPVQSEEEEIAELIKLSETGQIKLPNITHVPGRTYPELKKVRLEKQQASSSTKTTTKPQVPPAVSHVIGDPEPKAKVPILAINVDICVGFALGCAISALVNVLRTLN